MKLRLLLLSLSLLSFLVNAQNNRYQGQAPIQGRPITKTRPTIPQWKGTFTLPGGIYASNDFQGGRLNGLVTGENDTLIALISPENAPINHSPWYAFKIWSDVPKQVVVKMTYLLDKHRYYPKLSTNGENWSPLDSANYVELNKGEDAFGPNSRGETAVLTLDIGEEPLWVAAQELQTSKHVFAWMDELAKADYISVSEIGKSRQGRPLKAMHIKGKGKDKRMIMVISRQHPPEVTGYLAMKAIVETLASDSKLAKKFRKKYDIHVVPMVNPDGVDNGYWRHNVGGIDLNRDWADFNQPETAAVRDFMRKKVEKGGKFYFGIDCHSTWDDIYYTLPDSIESNLTGFTNKWLAAVENEIPGYEANIRPTDRLEPTLVSRNFFYVEFGAESLVYEIGDNTPRDFIKKKGKVSAEKLMEIILDEY